MTTLIHPTPELFSRTEIYHRKPDLSAAELMKLTKVGLNGHEKRDSQLLDMNKGSRHAVSQEKQLSFDTATDAAAKKQNVGGLDEEEEEEKDDDNDHGDENEDADGHWVATRKKPVSNSSSNNLVTMWNQPGFFFSPMLSYFRRWKSKMRFHRAALRALLALGRVYL